MTTQIRMAGTDSAGAGRTKIDGWLTWWTIHEADYDEGDLKQTARNAHIPQWMVDRVQGRTLRSAYLDATQLGAKGIPSVSTRDDPEKSSARYLTRDLGETTRALVREVTDRRGQKVGSSTVGRVYLDGTYNLRGEVLTADLALAPEVEKVITNMGDKMAGSVGMVDDGRLRALIIDWLERNYRICVRGTGGVYFIPRPSHQLSAETIEHELIAIRSWLNDAPIKGLFSIVEVSPGGATTMDAFVQSAVSEVQGELKDVMERLNGWNANAAMNAGSRAQSAGTMLDRIDTISRKAAVLIDSLGEEVAVVTAYLGHVQKRAQTMRDDAQNEVETTRNTRQEIREQQKQARRQEKQQGISGTAKARSHVERIG